MKFGGKESKGYKRWLFIVGNPKWKNGDDDGKKEAKELLWQSEKFKDAREGISKETDETEKSKQSH